MRQFVYEKHPIGHPPFDDALGQIGLHHCFVDLRAWFLHGDQNGPLVPFGVRNTNGTCLCNTWAANRDILKLD